MKFELDREEMRFTFKATRPEAELNEALLKEIGITLVPAMRPDDNLIVSYSVNGSVTREVPLVIDRLNILLGFCEAGYEIDYEPADVKRLLNHVLDLAFKLEEVLECIKVDRK